MPAPVITPSFSTGELSPGLYGRVDFARWHSSAALLRNLFVDYRGGAANRAGTAFSGPCLPGVNRVIPFQFSSGQTYALVFSDKAMRVVKAGAFVLENQITTVQALALNPFRMVVFPSTQPLYNVGDWVYVQPSLTNVGVMQRFAGDFLRINNIAGGGAPYYEMGDFTGTPIDSTPYVAATGGISRVYTLATPYAAADLALLKFTQSADTMTFCHPNYPPMSLTRTADNAWTLAQISFAPSGQRPLFPFVTAFGAPGTTTYRYVVTMQGGNGVTESLPSVSGQITTAPCMSAVAGTHMNVVWDFDPSIPFPITFNIYRQPEVRDAAPGTGQLYGFVGTVVLPSIATPAQFMDCNIVPDFAITPPIDPGILEAAGDHPGCTVYYQQRQAFGGSLNRPSTTYFSKTGDFYNMQYSSPSRPNDAIVATLVSNQVNRILHLVSMDALLAFTSNSAWKIDAGANGGAISPSSLDALAQAYNGCSDVPPIVVNRDVLYVQAKGSSVRDLAYNDFVKIYTGEDLSVLSSHLFAGHKIIEWTYAEEPHKLIWCVRDDGVALIFTYLKEQEVYAWTHAITDGQFKSVASISEGNENAVYFVVQRLYKGQLAQFVERLASRQLGEIPELGVPADFTRCWFVDAGLSTGLTYPVASLTVNGGELQPTGGWWVTPHVMAANVAVQGAGYSAGAYGVVQDPTGAGATVALTIAGGAITAAVVTAKGTGYTNPTLTIIDPAGTGAGAAVALQIGREIELLSDLPAMGTIGVGSLFVGNGGYGTVTAVNSARSITVDFHQQLANNFPMVVGSWSATARISTVRGLDHLEGRTVTGLADGNVISPRTVVGGQVALDAPAAAIVVGLPYTARMETNYSDIPGEAPTVQGRRKRISNASIRVASSRGLKIGVKGTLQAPEELVEFAERSTELMGDPIRAYTGDRRQSVSSSFDVRAQLVVQQDLPLPATILAVIPELTIGDSPSP